MKSGGWVNYFSPESFKIMDFNNSNWSSICQVLSDLPLTTTPTFKTLQTQKKTYSMRFLKLMILNDLSNILVDFRERFEQKLTAKLRFFIFRKKYRTMSAIRFHQKPEILKKKIIFS